MNKFQVSFNLRYKSFIRSSNKYFSVIPNQIVSDVKETRDETGSKKLFAYLNSRFSRHTIIKEVKKEEIRVASNLVSVERQIRNLATKVLPKVESFIEEKLLDNFMQGLNPKERELVEDAYLLRKHKSLKTISRKGLKSEQEQTADTIEWNLKDVVSIFNGKGIAKLTQADLGKYIYFPKEIEKEYFPTRYYGHYYRDEGFLTKTLSLMCREESLIFQNCFAYLKTQEEREPYIKELRQELLNDEFFVLTNLTDNSFFHFSLIFKEISDSVLDIVNTSTKHLRYKSLFHSAEVFDGFVTSLVQSMKNKEFSLFLICDNTRRQIITRYLDVLADEFGLKWKLDNQILGTLKHKITEEDILSVLNFDRIANVLKEIKFDLSFNDLIEFCSENNIDYNKELIKEGTSMSYTLNLKDFEVPDDFQFRPKDYLTTCKTFRGFNSGVLLHGESGSGKSCILSHLHAWAKEQDWAVIPVFRASRLTKDPGHIEPHLSGLFLTHEFAKELLLEIKLINYKILADHTVDLRRFGKINMAGVRDGENDPIPVLWDDIRGVYTDSYKVYHPEESKYLILRYPDQPKRISDFLPEPKTLLDIVNYGLDNERFSTNAIAEILDQLKFSKTQKTMILIDEYNDWFRASSYLSYKYANYYDTKIPPYDLALVRLFIHFDGHLWPNGIKVCSTSIRKFHLHKFDPKVLNWPRRYDWKVGLLKLNDLRNAVYYYNENQALGYKVMNEDDILYLYNNSQGNWLELQKDLKYEVDYVPKFKYYLERKITTRAILGKNYKVQKKLKKIAKQKVSDRLEEINKKRKFLERFRSHY